MRIRIPCVRCDLHQTCKTVKMGGDGPTDAQVLFVGEAPGQTEDRLGIPFVGESGQLLRAAIEDAGLTAVSRITNVIRCRPPENDKPTPKQVAKCAPWLDEEILATNPRLIVALGDTALQRLTGLRGVVGKSGEVLSTKIGDRTFPVLVAVHPAFCLRRPERIPDLQQQVHAASRLLKAESEWKNNYELIDRYFGSGLVSIGLSSLPVSFDYETTGLDPWRSEVICAAISLEDGAGLCFPLDTEERRKDWRDWLLSPVPKIVHHGRFERVVSKVRFNVWPRNVIWDTMIAAHVQDENQSKALKDLVRKYTDMGAFRAAEARTLILKEGPQALTLKNVWQYNCEDADGTRRLYAVQKDSVDRRLVDWSLRYDEMLSRMTERGVPVAEKDLPHALTYNAQLLEAAAAEVLDYGPAKKMFEETGELNLNSPKQVRELLFDKIGLKTSRYHRTDGGLPSVGKDFLNEAKDWHPIIPKILAWRRIEQIRKNFLKPLLDVVIDGYVHPEWNATGTRTWRLSCSNPNLQNVPKDDFIRGLFRAPPGKVFVCADYSQIELRVVAALTKDERLRKAFEAGLDIHAWRASELFKVHIGGVTEKMRSRGKTVNFGVLYGISAHGLRQKYGIPEDEGEDLLRRFWDSSPRLVEWMNKIEADAFKGRVRSPFGRVKHFEIPVADLMEREQAHELRAATNFPIQSAAGEITLRAMIEVEEQIRNLDLVIQVHDSIIGICDESEASAVGEELRRVMVGMSWPWLDVPLEVEVEVGPTLGSVVALKGEDDADEGSR